MTTVQKLLTYGGLKKQASKGSVSTTPAITGFGIASGKLISTPLVSEYEDLTLLGGTTSDRFSPAVNRISVTPAAAFSTRATVNSLASILFGVLGTDVTAGAGPYTHTATPAIALNYYGLFAKYGAIPEAARLNDAKFDSVKISVADTHPAMIDVAMMGTGLTFDVGAWTATNDDSILQALPAIGGTFQFDPAGSAVAQPISGWSLEIKNNLQPVFLSASMQPDDIVEGEQTVEGSFSLTLADLNTMWQAIMTGTGAGTTFRAAALYGAMSLTLTLSASANIVVTAPHVEFIADWPDSDPKGGAAMTDVSFRVIRPTDGSAAFTIVTTNALSGAPG